MRKKLAKEQSNYIPQKTTNVSTTREKDMLKYLTSSFLKEKLSFHKNGFDRETKIIW